ncbi:MAG TPA: glycosyltransferase [Bryobacteraceae bacterium]|nr:glycosyltransferase [Bryobacteraceae bacterium]
MFFWETIGGISLAAWIYLLAGRGGFWRIRAGREPTPGGSSAAVAVVVPARDEEAVIGKAIQSLIAQDYPGRFHIFLVDDHSTDNTVSAAGAHERLTVLRAGPRPLGWTGKLWAVSEGLERARQFEPGYVLLTDADIVHPRDSVSHLVARAEAAHLDLVSWMVKLQCRTLAERALIPAFVFFFFKLYPPSWIASPRHKAAGAAGGCMLVRSSALARIGGIASIRGELIDDCALARAIKPGGGIWLGVTPDVRSIRDYSSFAEIGRMISRGAFTQLRHSVLLLAGTLAGMALLYLAPPLLLLTRDATAALLGLGAWILMTIAYVPVLRFYGRSPAWAPSLPLIALFYMGATLDSARRYWTGAGGMWKGRVQDLN